MLQDHMPDKVLAALKKVIAEFDDERGSSVHSYSTASWSDPVEWTDGRQWNRFEYGMTDRWHPYTLPHVVFVVVLEPYIV